MTHTHRYVLSDSTCTRDPEILFRIDTCSVCGQVRVKIEYQSRERVMILEDESAQYVFPSQPKRSQ